MKTSVLESIFKKVAGLKHYSGLLRSSVNKKILQGSHKLWVIASLFRTIPILIVIKSLQALKKLVRGLPVFFLFLKNVSPQKLKPRQNFKNLRFQWITLTPRLILSMLSCFQTWIFAWIQIFTWNLNYSQILVKAIFVSRIIVRCPKPKILGKRIQDC